MRACASYKPLSSKLSTVVYFLFDLGKPTIKKDGVKLHKIYGCLPPTQVIFLLTFEQRPSRYGKKKGKNHADGDLAITDIKLKLNH